MPLKNSNIEPATLRLNQILEDVRVTTNTQIVNANAQSTDVREVAIVRVCTTANITLSGLQTIDGISLAVGDSVLVNNQTSEANNGLYGVRSTAWVRLTNPVIIAGLPVIVREGTTNAETFWIQQREFTSYNADVTNLKWINIGSFSLSVTDTNTVNLTLSGTNLSADVRYQDSNAIDFSDDAGGLRADVKYATPTVGGVLSTVSGGVRFDHRLTTGRGINLFNNLPATGDLQVVNNIASGVGVKILENTPSAGVLTANHDINGTEGITVTDNSPSTGNLNLKVTDGGITTAKLADNAVTNAKLADDSVGANELLLVNSDGYLSYYSGAGTPVEQGIDFVDTKLRNNYKTETISGSGTGTTRTFRIPSNTSEYLPQGMYHLDIYGEITANTGSPFFTVKSHVTAPVLSVAVSGGGATNIDKGATHADPPSGEHTFLNNSLQGSLIIDLTTGTKTLRYFEITFDLNVNTGLNFSSVSAGYCHIFRLTTPSTTITYET